MKKHITKTLNAGNEIDMKITNKRCKGLIKAKAVKKIKEMGT